MPTLAPFTAYIKLYPAPVTKRTERVRELERLGQLIGAALEPDRSIWLANPGGGEVRSYGPFSTEQVGGVAVKPGFGETPPQATIVGFFDPYLSPNPTDNIQDDAPLFTQPEPDIQLFSGGNTWTGPSKALWAHNPSTRVGVEVKALKANLELYIGNGIPAGIDFKVFRIDYSNVTFGDRGVTFPA